MHIRPARIRFLEGGIPFSEEFGDVYFSPEGGLQETEYVFLDGNGFPARWDSQRSWTIAELGFGTGLNFLTTLKQWSIHQRSASASRLHFYSCELFPIPLADHVQALQFFPELQVYTQALMQRLPPRVYGLHCIDFPEWNATLHLFLGPVAHFLDAVPFTADAWFLDGFAPSKNEAMWGEQIGRSIATRSKVGTTVATFSVAAASKQVLRAAGFDIKKRKGFGRKREMLQGSLQLVNPPAVQKDLKRQIIPDPQPLRFVGTQPRIAVIGAGLAGCFMAHEIAKREGQVVLFDRRSAPLQEASGNPSGIFMPYFSAGESETSGYALQSLAYLNSLYPDISQLPGFVGERSGVAEILVSPDDELRMVRAIERLGLPADDPQFLDAHEAAALLGFRCEKPVVLHRRAGWLQPSALGRALLQLHEARIDCRWGREVKELVREERDDGAAAWRVDGEVFDAVVLANANEAKKFGLTEFLPLTPLRGQIALYPASDIGSGSLGLPVVAQEYLCPTSGTAVVLGATFDLKEESPELDPDRNVELLHRIQKDLGESVFASPSGFDPAQGRVAFRCTTADKLPVVGVVPDRDSYFEQYSAFFRGKAKAGTVLAPPRVHSGFYLLTGFGSRGITYIPLAARMLAAELFGEGPVVEESCRLKLSPARFLVRSLRKGEREAHA